MKFHYAFPLLLMVLLASCSGKRHLTSLSQPHSTEAWVPFLFDTAGVQSGLFMVEASEGPGDKKPVIDYHSASLFTPASNTKILTLYTALKFLPATLDGLKYLSRKDTTYFKGTGDPGFLDARFDSRPLWQFLSDQKNLVYLSDPDSDRRWAPGWSWEDYPYYYAAQRSPFPMYGNVVRAHCVNGTWNLEPSGFIVNRIQDPSLSAVRRKETANIFQVNTAQCPDHPLRIPFVVHPEVVRQLLADTLDRPVFQADLNDFNQGPDEWKGAPGSDRDTLLRAMMYASDNLIAEQMLWSASSALWDEVDTELMIDSMMNGDFKNWQKKILWVDGSGLSVYNKFSPRFLVEVLHRLYGSMPFDQLKHYFPAGGVRGTIASWYSGDEEPYVYAKTGTLSGVHCLSGYLRADSGKTYIFSFMHNNYLGSSNQYKKKMEVLLRWVKEHH